MTWEPSPRSSRRRFLKGSVGTSLGTLTTVPANSDLRGTNTRVDQQEGKRSAGEFLSGHVEYLDGSEVSHAELQVLAQPEEGETSPTIIAETTADENGRFEFEQLPLEKRNEVEDEYGSRNQVLAAEPPDSEASPQQRQWFRSYLLDLFDSDGMTLQLNGELLFGPLPAVTDEGNALGTISVWRTISENDKRQHLQCELVITSRSEPYAEPTAFANRTTEGVFSITVPDDIYIEYDEQWVGIVPYEQGLEQEPASEWVGLTSRHPLQTGFPLTPMNVVTHTVFADHMEAEAKAAEEIVERIIGLTPGVSTLFSIVDSFQWGFGEQFTVEASAGTPDLEPLDKNHHNTVANGWYGTAIAALFSVPIRVETEETYQVRARASWKTAGPLGTDQSEFGTEVSVEPLSSYDSTVDEVVATQTQNSWKPWVPTPQTLSVDDLGIWYWDFESIRDRIISESDISRDAIEYDSFPGSASPYSFVDSEQERGYIIITTEGANPLYEVITGELSKDDARRELEDASLDREEYKGYSLYHAEDYDVGVNEGAIIVPSVGIEDTDRRIELLKTVVDTNQGNLDSYYEGDADIQLLTDIVLETTVDLQGAHISPTNGRNSLFKDSVGVGAGWRSSDEHVVSNYCVLFQDESDVDLDSLRSTVDDTEDENVETEVQQDGRAAIITFTTPSAERERFSVDTPEIIGFPICGFLRPGARGRYTSC